MRKKKEIIVAMALVLLMLLAAFPMISDVSAPPITLSMMFSIFGTPGAVEAALVTPTVDMNDWPASSTFISTWATMPTTSLKYGAVSGATKIYVQSSSGFAVADGIKISPGEAREDWVAITAVGKDPDGPDPDTDPDPYFNITATGLVFPHTAYESVEKVNPITMQGYAAIDKFQVDMNNQWWPTGPNDPTHALVGPRNVFFNSTNPRHIAAWHFRRAMAHLVDKAQYVTSFLGGYGYILETEVPVPALEGFTDYSTLINATAKTERADNPYADSGYIYEHDRNAAVKELELGGFQDWDGDTFIEWNKKYPDAWTSPADTEELPNMKLWELAQSPWASITTAFMSETAAVGIPAALLPNAPGLWVMTATPETTCFNNVAIMYNYNFFFGGSWIPDADVGFIYDLYHSSMGQYTWATNYPGFKNAEFDAVAERVKFPVSLADVKFAAVQAQWVKAKYVPVIELWSSEAVKAYRTGWDDVVNTAGYGVDNQYSFQLMSWTGGPGLTQALAGTIVYGISNDPRRLHIITEPEGWANIPVAHMAWWNMFSGKVLSGIYDSLLGRNPYNLAEDVGWLAQRWSVGTWGSPPKSVVEFDVRTGATFHDGSPVKPADVAFSLLMPRDAGSGIAWNYPAVMDINSVEIQGQTIRVYFNVESTSALHWAGFMPIINKDLWWQAIGDGSAADYNGGFIADDTDGTYTGGTFTNPAAIRLYNPWTVTTYGNPALVDLVEDGSGPWTFTAYTPGVTVTLAAFTSYYTAVYAQGYNWIDLTDLPGTQDYDWPGTSKTELISDYPYWAFHRQGNVNFKYSWGSAYGVYPSIDKKVTLYDLILIAISMPSSAGPQPWPGAYWGFGQIQYNIDADINQDGQVNVVDLATAGRNYNKEMG